MDVTLTATVTHLCPYMDEVDVGTVTLDYRLDGELIELHDLAGFLRAFHGQRISHEALTEAVAARYPGVRVTTAWTTAGIGVVCRVVPGDSVRPEGA